MNKTKPTTIAGKRTQSLTGAQFKVARHPNCVWTVLYYHRNGDWVCEEPDRHTTCHFHESEITAGRVERTQLEEIIEQAVDRIERFAKISNYTEVGNAVKDAIKAAKELTKVAILLITLAFGTVSAHAQTSTPETAMPYDVDFIANPSLPYDAVEVAPVQQTFAAFYNEKPTAKPPGLPATFVLVWVYCHFTPDQWTFVGWFWLDATTVIELHKPIDTETL